MGLSYYSTIFSGKFQYLRKKINLLPILLAASLLAGCSAEDATTKYSFLFDTAVSVRGSEAVCDEVLSALGGISLSLDGYAGELKAVNDGGIGEGDILSLAEKCLSYREELPQINILCGQLSELWAISENIPDEERKIPSAGEISAALSTADYGNISLDGGVALKNGARLDFGSAAKGYALDRVYSELLAGNSGVTVVSMGSSALLCGEKKGGFTVDIRDPEGGIAGRLTLPQGGFISTSGGYERFFTVDGVDYCHILDMRTGYPVESDLSSVSVIFPVDYPDGGLLSDLLSTEIFIEGSAGLKKHLSADYSVIAITENGEIFTSDGLNFERSE